MTDLPHLDWPIRVTGSTYAEVEQDSTADAGAQVAALLCFERGSRAEDTDFGITDATFQQAPVDTTEITQQCSEYVPQATVQVTTTTQPDGSTSVSVSVATTNLEDT